jgi:excinuclease ABC subunit B
MGRAARNLNGAVVLYADKITGSIQAAMDETGRRREFQETHNQINNITPRTIEKPIFDLDLLSGGGNDTHADPAVDLADISLKDIRKRIDSLKTEMWTLARDEKFEEAATVRDSLKRWEQLELDLS